ncbi:hypothetical protein [Bacillus sp. SD088]|uniref:hypothetical protein n=1 Tax=Bacillus sp. SD088 TaxID=2782012 RepID=UPI001A9664AA|nr:hypothetical protein [Bacillus sp. SD088]MBO0996031.1 hypothetical protein [Bacillus sp. SD088]
MGKFGKIIGVAGAVAGATYLSSSENREKIKSQFTKVVSKLNSSYIKDLGKPSEVEDAKMVDEGAMTSVQYYNELQEESGEE